MKQRLTLAGAGAIPPGPVFAFDVSRFDNDNSTYQSFIYVVNEGGGAAVSVASPATDIFYFTAVLSPDASKIAFLYSGASPPYEQLWVMDSDGSNAMSLVVLSACKNPQWIGNDTIAYFRAGSLLRIDADGTNGATIRAGGIADSHKWGVSPDHTQIAYMFANTPTELFVIDVDGSNDTQLASDIGTEDLVVVWRRPPDDDYIFYYDSRVAVQEFRLIKRDGTGLSTVSALGTLEGFFYRGGMGDDNMFFTSTDAHPDWRLAQLPLPSGTWSDVSPTLHLRLAVQQGVAARGLDNRIYTVLQEGYPGVTADYVVSVEQDGSGLDTHFVPDQSGTPYFENAFITTY